MKALKLLLLVPVLLATACGITGSRGNGDDNYFSDFCTFDSQEWPYSHTVVFTVDTLRDSLSRGGTLLLSLRHTVAYPYSNIWLELSYPTPDGILAADTFNILLADDYGHWRGYGNGPSMAITDTLSRNFDIARHGMIRLRHIMRTDTLPNIEQVGIVYLPND